jgi:phenylacetate-CoA ligase
MPRLTESLKLLRFGDVAVRRNPLFYADARKILDELERATLEERHAWTQKRLEGVLWSARRSPYGKRVKGTKEIESWPFLSKQTVQGAPRSFCTYSPLLTVRATTGGTSGMPLQVFRSMQSVAFEQASLDEMMRRLGADGRIARTAVLRTDVVKDPNDVNPPYWIHANGGRRLVFSSSHLNANTISHFVQALNDFKPDVMMAYPTSLEALCVLLEAAGLRVCVPRIVCSSEVLQARVWRLAIDRLGCDLLDRYGQAERVAFAYARSPGEYRFLPGYAHLEFRHAGSEEEGTDLYEVVGTPLWNRSMSLIRYCTGDLIRVPSNWGASELHEVSLGARSFSGIIGRSGDILLTPEGVKVTGISHFHRDVAHIQRIQVIQETVNDISVLVVATADFSQVDEAHLMRNIRRKLPESMRVTIHRTESLERSAIGKTPFVIHRPAVKALLQPVQTASGQA